MRQARQYEPAALPASGTNCGTGWGSLDEPFPDKPKGMHWKRYRRLAERDEALDDIWVRELSDWLRRAEKRS
jgi:hypothetical protein